MRKTIALATALCALFAATALAATKTVKVGDNWFVRSSSGTPTVTVSKGTTVKWSWVEDSAHNVVVTKGPVKFSSPVKTSGSYKKVMKRRGTYTIICTIHGKSDQAMKLVVK